MALIEFIVDGPPVSHQSRNKSALQAWKAQVRAAARSLWVGAPVKGLLECTIMNFYAGPAPPLVRQRPGHAGRPDGQRLRRR